MDLEGCEVLFPDSLFFTEDGKPDFIAKTDKEGKILAIKDPKRLEKLQEIRKSFSDIVRKRIQENKTLLEKLNLKEKAA